MVLFPLTAKEIKAKCIEKLAVIQTTVWLRAK